MTSEAQKAMDELKDSYGRSSIMSTRAIETIRTALQSTRTPERELDAAEKQVMHDALRASVKVVPVDTINIKREVLQGVRDMVTALIGEHLHLRNEHDYISLETEVTTEARKYIASLDAVLSEGE